MTTRRNFLKGAALGALATGLAPGLVSATSVNPSGNAKRSLRIAHITDVHITDKPQAEACFERVLKEINSMSDKPDLIINTGDTVMDENKQTRETVEKRWQVWNRIVSRVNKIPMRSAIGNHDVWYGPDEKLDAEYKKDKRYGKQWAIDELALPNRYYSFEKNGWKFIALDSINGKVGYSLDEEQFSWLDKELAAVPDGQPVLVFSHVPLLSACATMYLIEREEASATKYPIGDQHTDTKRVKTLFHKNKTVKLCLSGHVHYIDAVEYLGVKYLCNGAVSGNWWGNPLALDEFPPVYTVIDLFYDGTSQHQHIYYNTQI
jgi:3',5'-cyclic AMP phosphodiesterase CpdA